MSGTRLGGVNARDIRIMLRGKIDPEIGKVLVGLAERQDHLYQLMGQLASHMDTMASGLLATTSGIQALKEKHDEIKQARRGGVTVASEVARDQDE